MEEQIESHPLEPIDIDRIVNDEQESPVVVSPHLAQCEDECCICWEIIELKDMVHLLSLDSSRICIHTFHKLCISLVPQKLCPLCRHPFHDFQLSHPKDTSVFTFPSETQRNTEITSPPQMESVNNSSTERQRRTSSQTNSSQIINNNANRRNTPQRRSSSARISVIQSSLIVPLEILRRQPPAEVNKQSMETHLSDEEFLQVFKMERQTFASLSKGQKITLRKRNGLYISSILR